MDTYKKRGLAFGLLFLLFSISSFAQNTDSYSCYDNGSTNGIEYVVEDVSLDKKELSVTSRGLGLTLFKGSISFLFSKEYENGLIIRFYANTDHTVALGIPLNSEGIEDLEKGPVHLFHDGEFFRNYFPCEKLAL